MYGQLILVGLFYLAYLSCVCGVEYVALLSLKAIPLLAVVLTLLGMEALPLLGVVLTLLGMDPCWA